MVRVHPAPLPGNHYHVLEDLTRPRGADQEIGLGTGLMMQHGERWVDPFELRFFADSPEARSANEFARKLLTARATADKAIPENKMSPLYVEASVRVFAEILASAKTRIDRDLVICWGYFVHALSIIAASGVWIAADLLADAEGINIDEARERVVSTLAEAMEGNDQSL